MRYRQKLPFSIVISVLGLTISLAQASLPQDINHYFRQIHGKKTKFLLRSKRRLNVGQAVRNPKSVHLLGAEIWEMYLFQCSVVRKNNLFS